MPAFRFRKRRRKAPTNKNQLKIAREKADQRMAAQADTLQGQFPHVRGLGISWRMLTSHGAMLEEKSFSVTPDQPFLFDVGCEGGCGKGAFLLTEAVKGFILTRSEDNGGKGVCQAPSYSDPKAPCGTVLEYRVKAAYLPEEESTEEG